MAKLKKKTEPETQKAIVNGMRRLPRFIEDAYLKTEEDKYGMLLSDCGTYIQQMKAIFNMWFPKVKPISDADIVNQIHRHDIENKDLQIWVKYSLACLIKTSERIKENIINYKKQDEVLFKKEIELMREISFEAAIFMEDAFRIMEESKVDFGHGKRFYIYSRETFDASRELIRKVVLPRTHGGFVVGPTSIFLLRQAIEIWLKDIFGINAVLDKDSKPVKLQPERLFELIQNKSVELPIPHSTITKIHQWTQPYVHGGYLVHIWEIEHAQTFLQPIFYSDNVKIKRSYFDSIEGEIKRILDRKDIKVIKSKSPWCKLVD